MMEIKDKLRLIYRWTYRDFKTRINGVPYLMVSRNGSCLVPLDQLTDAEIDDRIGFAIKKQAERDAAVKA